MLQNISLNSVRVFEAVARNGSLRAAADDLNLSPSAVSHSLQRLEQSLGVTLFEREGRSVKLSVEGELLLRHVGQAFESLKRGLESVSSRGSKLLRLHAAPTFAARWLSPRLPQFSAAHPDIELRITASTEYARFTNDDFDADIVYGPVRSEGAIVVPLGVEHVTPLCAPAMAAGINRPEDLLSLTLIQSDRKQVRWSDWFAENGLEAAAPHRAAFDRSFLAIAAAVDGGGIVLESTRLAEREIMNGTLVPPLAGRSRDLVYVGHFLVFPRDGSKRQAVRKFGTWLIEQLKLDATLPD
jgi:LysR family transcriptional regulator, glycine cleavage system transcriptional activator